MIDLSEVSYREILDCIVENTIMRLFFEIDGLFDGNEISKLLHTISLQTQRRVNISIHCNADR